MNNQQYITAYYLDDDDLMKSVKHIREKGLSINDVLTPFPVHGLDKLLGHRRSYLPQVGFIGGAIGAICGFYFQYWIFTEAYPLNFGGKPFASIPSFIPVTFECTVLFAAFSMFFAFLIRSGLGLGAQAKIHDEKVTDDRFMVIIPIDESNRQDSINHIEAVLNETGAKEVKVNG
ncbi:MAG: DUF3341 domain-containing protein [Bacteroidetes bacterium]|jgi:hypothetical protein|nr:DUF3341 domain-containing protein [Bacteroidota bacterium]